jgi:hypothetical protein
LQTLEFLGYGATTKTLHEYLRSKLRRHSRNWVWTLLGRLMRALGIGIKCQLRLMIS